ncbi:MAG: SWIM zinc finger family protein [Acidimicrobiia bacterium]
MSSWYPPSKPRPVENGIKARSRRGAIAQNWWSERFIEVLESIGVGGRLQRGKTYARKGQVLELELIAGAVNATVQGSRARPYKVRIGVDAFGKTEWAQVCEALADDAWYAANLLAGDMPKDIEDVFGSLGLSLFPSDPAEMTMDCTCPDWEVPCKHLAAAFYLLAESFDEDPFMILAWRGRDRDRLLETLSALRGGGESLGQISEGETTVPLADCLDSYFLPQGPTSTRAMGGSPSSDTWLTQLPAVDITVRGQNLLDVLPALYRAIGDAGEPPLLDP